MKIGIANKRLVDSLTPRVVSTLALLTGLFLAAQHLQAQRYPFRLYGQEKGLTSPTVRSLLQDRTGFLWVGTSNGLFRYDGSRFRAYFGAEGIPAGPVRALHETPNGGLVAGTTAGVVELHDGRFRPLDHARAVSVGQNGALASDGQNLYIATGVALLVVPHDRSLRSRIFTPPPGAGLNGVLAVHRDPGGVVWTSCGGGLCRWTGSALERVKTNTLPSDKWVAIETDAGGTLWVRSNTQIWRRYRGRENFEQVMGDFIALNRAISLRLDPLGRIAVPTQFGLYIDNEGGWMRMSEDTGLPANQASDVLWDREGNLWVGLETYGLARLLGMGSWQGFTTQNGLSTNTVTAILRDRRGWHWIGTAFGLNLFDADFRHVRLWTRHSGLPADDIRSLALDPHGGVWAGLASGGLVHFDSPQSPPRRHGVADGLGDDRIIKLDLTRDGTLWVSTRDGLYRTDARARPARFEKVPLPAHLGDDTSYKVLFARDGALWAAGRQGLLLREGSAWRSFGKEQGLKDQNLAFLTEDDTGALWVGYGGVFGVSRVVYRNGRISVTHYRAPDSLTSDNISFLEADERGRVWIGTDYGVNVFDHGRIVRLGTDDGLVWQDCVLNSFLAEPGGPIWIGTNRGVSRFSPPPHFPTPAPPAVVVTSVDFPRRSMPLPDNPEPVEISPNDRFVRIQFSALTFSGESSVRFRYRLAGRTTEWVPSPQNEVILQDLSPGDFQFEVQARLMGGSWGPAATLPLRILAPWYATWWFRLLVALMVADFAYLLWRRRARRQREREHELEAAVAQRTREIEIEKAKVEEQKHDIERLLREARQAGRLKDEFLANISHEIRTPMHAILGMTALALATSLTDEQREYMETVDTSARSLLHLLNEILDFSKIESGAVELEHIAFSVRHVVENVVRTGTAFARGKGLELLHHVDADVPASLAGDPTRLRQILLNLFTNAIKFTERGQVRLDVDVVAGDASRFLLRFTVSDTGIGIPAEKIPVIWDPFRQADGSTTRRYGGTGLGLAICRRLVEVMGGSIGVDSVPGQGSRFSFEVGFDTVPAGADSVRSSRASSDLLPSRSALHVLLVEDNEVSRRFASRLLEKQGCRVALAANGGEAVERVHAERFDAILMDLQMPVLDGLAATRLIRELDRLHDVHTPVVILTANAGIEARNMALDAGADAYLTKPIDLSALAEVLDRIALPPDAGYVVKKKLRPV